MRADVRCTINRAAAVRAAGGPTSGKL